MSILVFRKTIANDSCVVVLSIQTSIDDSHVERQNDGDLADSDDSGSDGDEELLPEDRIMESDSDDDDDCVYCSFFPLYLFCLWQTTYTVEGISWRRNAYAAVHVLPLYSLMEPNEQSKIFKPVEPNTRLIVIATNIAETSITIPGIRYVLDAGHAKQKRFNPVCPPYK